MLNRHRRCCLCVYLLTGLLAFTGTALSALKKPVTVAEIAMYNGADRQQILEEGAKREGKLAFYTTASEYGPVVAAFQKKYPYIKLETWRASPTQVLPKVLEEYKAGKQFFDIIQTSQSTMLLLQKVGMLQPFYSPNTASIEDGAITKAPGGGVFRAAFWESAVGLAYNTKLIVREELPKTYQDLLDPKWKGKLAIVDGGGEESWVGSMLVAYGEDFVRRMAKQNFIIFHGGSPVIINMLINGEYAFLPSVFDSKVEQSRKKGATIDWVPMEPVPVNLGQIALPKFSSRPHATLLFIDFWLSKETAEIAKAQFYNSTRKDITGTKTYKKFYGAESAEEALKFKELFTTLFLKQ